MIKIEIEKCKMIFQVWLIRTLVFEGWSGMDNVYATSL